MICTQWGLTGKYRQRVLGALYILWLNDPVGDGDILADAFGSECCRDGMSVGNWWFTGSALQKWDFVQA
jgi:hypothetical protein